MMYLWNLCLVLYYSTMKMSDIATVIRSVGHFRYVTLLCWIVKCSKSQKHERNGNPKKEHIESILR